MSSGAISGGFLSLVEIAEHDPDPESRRLAWEIFDVLIRVHRVSRAPPDLPVRDSDRWRDHLFSGGPGPDLGGYRGDDGAAAWLLTWLVNQVLQRPAESARDRERAAARLRAISGDLPPGARARLPELGRVEAALGPIERGSPAARIVGLVLAVVEPGDVLAALADWLSSPDRRLRREVLEQLAGAAPLIRDRGQVGDADALTPVIGLVSYFRPPPGRPSPMPYPQREVYEDHRPPAAGWSPSRPDEQRPDQAQGATGAYPRPVRSRSAGAVYARFEAPERVAPAVPFVLYIGLAAAPGRGVLPAVPLEIPSGSFTLTVELMLDGFRAMNDQTVFKLWIRADHPHVSRPVELVAIDDPGLSAARTIMAVFSVDGEQIGVATRAVLVPRDPGARVPPPVRPPAPGEDWALPGDGRSAPDLTITIARGNDSAERRLLWAVRTPHAGLPVPERAVTGSLNEGAAEWARRVMRGVEERTGYEDLAFYLRGIAATVSEAVPRAVWDSLDAAARINPAPSVLLATADPYIPWELARVPRAWADDRAPYLGTQTRLGRWIYREQGRTAAPRPRLSTRHRVVVKGVYPGGRRLPEAEAEADGLVAEHAAHPIPAELGAVLDCLGSPAADLVHFAVHGRFDPTGTRDGILLADDKVLDPLSVRGIERSGARLVFLNACQLAQGQRMLGDYAGMAPAFVAIGVQAVIAPLWKVDDSVARDLARSFYRAVRAGAAPAEFLRAERERAVRAGTGTRDGSRLAYLFFGHPHLRIDWEEP